MHSYSGPVNPVKQFLHPSNPSDVYFSFSTVINFSGPSAQKVIDVIKALPDDRVLIESDLHTAGPPMDDLLEQVARVSKQHGLGLYILDKELRDNNGCIPWQSLNDPDTHLEKVSVLTTKISEGLLLHPHAAHHEGAKVPDH